MLIRVSSIDDKTSNAYEMQNQFVNEMLAALAPEYREKLNGRLQLK
jgi:hypothetical protein